MEIYVPVQCVHEISKKRKHQSGELDDTIFSKLKKERN